MIGVAAQIAALIDCLQSFAKPLSCMYLFVVYVVYFSTPDLHDRHALTDLNAIVDKIYFHSLYHPKCKPLSFTMLSYIIT